MERYGFGARVQSFPSSPQKHHDKRQLDFGKLAVLFASWWFDVWNVVATTTVDQLASNDIDARLHYVRAGERAQIEKKRESICIHVSCVINATILISQLFSGFS